jgi:hypothetical protein
MCAYSHIEMKCDLAWAEFSRLTHTCQSDRCPFVQQTEYCQAEPSASEHQPGRPHTSELPHTHTHTRARARAHMRTRTRTRAHTHSYSSSRQGLLRSMNDAITSAHPWYKSLTGGVVLPIPLSSWWHKDRSRGTYLLVTYVHKMLLHCQI